MKQEKYNQQYGMGNIFNFPIGTGVLNPAEIITISGTVVDEDNQPVPGANVVISGTSIGTMADFDGRFTLNNVPSNSIIDFSYQGQITKYPALEAKGTILIKTVDSLSEIVINAPGAKPSNFWKYASWGILGALAVYAISKEANSAKPAPSAKPRLAAPRKRRNSKKTHVKVTL